MVWIYNWYASMYVVADAVENVKYGFLVFEISLLTVILFGILMHFASPWCIPMSGSRSSLDHRSHNDFLAPLVLDLILPSGISLQIL